MGRSFANLAPSMESHPIHPTQELPGSALRDREQADAHQVDEGVTLDERQYVRAPGGKVVQRDTGAEEAGTVARSNELHGIEVVRRDLVQRVACRLVIGLVGHRLSPSGEGNMKEYATSGSVPKYRIGLCAIGFGMEAAPVGAIHRFLSSIADGRQARRRFR